MSSDILDSIEDIMIGSIALGPVALALLGMVVLIGLVIGVQLIASKGARMSFMQSFRARYSKYWKVIIFLTFFILSLMAVYMGMGFSDPFLIVIAFILIILFEGWSVSNTKRTITIVLVAFLGAIVGHNMALFLKGG